MTSGITRSGQTLVGRRSLLYTDTDSLLFEVETVNIYEDMKQEHQRI